MSSNWPNRATGNHPAEGCIVFVKDEAWGFSAPGRVEHPGLILWLADDLRYCTLLKGTDAEFVRDQRRVFIVEPSEMNGLAKPTAFRLEPRTLPRRLVMLMLESPRYIGAVSDTELDAARYQLSRSFGGTGGWRR
jgi:hypothetical protein